jgi:AraC-like DNA-binding protein
LSVGFIARELAMSIRALQIRLQQENTIFADLLKNTRERVAKKSLRENDTVENITFILGFSDVSSFRRAFKKWTGMTPGEYRKKVCTLP